MTYIDNATAGTRTPALPDPHHHLPPAAQDERHDDTARTEADHFRGLLSFPVTDFDRQGNFRPETYVKRLEWLAPYGASALFAAGGTGEFFSLTPDDYSNVIRTAVETCAGKVPILAGAGGPTRMAIAYAQEAQRLAPRACC